MSRRKESRPCKKHGGTLPAEVSGCAEQDWDRECIVCGAKPVVCCTEMCGPCTFGEAETVGGSW